jgi:CheY-like chemotaxis protein
MKIHKILYTLFLVMHQSDHVMPLPQKYLITRCPNHRVFRHMAYRVLLMDDEPAICEITGILLKKMGYDPTIAVTGEEALAEYKKARENGNPYDVLILDLTIPGAMGGREVISIIRETDPEVKVLVSSGDLSDPAIVSYKEVWGFGVLAKPYNKASLDQAIKSVLS